MKIAALETVPYRLPFKEPYITARGRLEHRKLLLVRLRTSGGPIGFGEVAPLALRGGADLAWIEAELRERCAPILVGQKLTLSTLGGLIAGVAASGVSAQALCAVDLAMHDLVGRIEGEPVWRLLGAREAKPVHCNATLVAGEPPAVADAAERWVADGYDSLKLKVGVEDDVRQVGSVRERVGPAVRIRVDANGAWSPEQAIERLNAMAVHRIELAEQPGPDIEGLARVRRGVRCLVAADESIVSREDAEAAIASGACDLATLKLSKCGGIAACLAIAETIPIYLSSALDGPIGIAAAAHLVQALPKSQPAAGLAHGLATQRLFSDTIAAKGPELQGPNLHIPDEPGLGVELDELSLARHRI